MDGGCDPPRRKLVVGLARVAASALGQSGCATIAGQRRAPTSHAGARHVRFGALAIVERVNREGGYACQEPWMGRVDWSPVVAGASGGPSPSSLAATAQTWRSVTRPIPTRPNQSSPSCRV